MTIYEKRFWTAKDLPSSEGEPVIDLIASHPGRFRWTRIGMVHPELQVRKPPNAEGTCPALVFVLCNGRRTDWSRNFNQDSE